MGAIKHVNEQVIYKPLSTIAVLYPGNRDTITISVPAGTASVPTTMGDYFIIRAGSFVAGEALAFGEAVAWDFSAAKTNTVVLADTDNINDVFVGIVMNESVASGAEAYVLLEGIHPMVKMLDSTVSIGDAAQLSATAGAVDALAEAGTLIEFDRVGIVLTADADIGTSDFRAPVQVFSKWAAGF